MFGWIYMLAAFQPTDLWPKLPTQSLLELLAPQNVGIVGPFPNGRMGGGMGMRLWSVAAAGGFAAETAVGAVRGPSGGAGSHPFFQIGHCLFTLLAASVGAFLSRWLFGAVVDDESKTITRVSHTVAQPTPRRWWVVPLVFPLSGLAFVSIASAGSILPTGVWAGSTFLLTCCLLGLLAFRALIDRGRREAWLAAALFGTGFMIMAFLRVTYEPWPHLPTTEFLDELRPWLPGFMNGLGADSKSITAANARIREALKQPVPMHFHEETPLEDVLKSVRKATTGTDGKGIPIYVDPIGLSEADKTPTSTVRSIELDGVPLRASLRLCLNQLDLGFRVTDGYLLITAQESLDRSLLSAPEDAFHVVGHCLLAFIAAALGGFAARLLRNGRQIGDCCQ